MLLDALGSVRISKKFLARLEEAGGHVAFFMPMIHLPFRGRANLRNHRKMIVCDHQIGMIGGMNLAAEYMGPQTYAGRWRDLSLTVQGPVMEHIVDIFRSDWSFASKVPLQNASAWDQPNECGAMGLTQLVASGPDVQSDSLRNAILGQIFRAERRVWIVTPYFIPDEFLLEALCIAVHRNVEVSIITPKKSNHRLADLVREGYVNRLQESGAEVWLYEPCMLHAKALLVDDKLAMVGSANMDMRSMLLNYEVALCLYDPCAIAQLEAFMLGLKKDCSPRARRSAPSFGLVEGVVRLFAPLL